MSWVVELLMSRFELHFTTRDREKKFYSKSTNEGLKEPNFGRQCFTIIDNSCRHSTDVEWWGEKVSGTFEL